MMADQNLQSQLDRIEAMLSELLGRKAIDPAFLPLAEAARLAGRSVQGLQCLLRRERAKVDGFPIRRVHGGVHRQDLLAYLHEKSKSQTGRGARIRAALAGLEARR